MADIEISGSRNLLHLHSTALLNAYVCLMCTMWLCDTRRSHGHILNSTCECAHTRTRTHRHTHTHAFISLNQINLSYAFECFAKYFRVYVTVTVQQIVLLQEVKVVIATTQKLISFCNWLMYLCMCVLECMHVSLQCLFVSIGFFNSYRDSCSRHTGKKGQSTTHIHGHSPQHFHFSLSQQVLFSVYDYILAFWYRVTRFVMHSHELGVYCG